MSSNLATTHTWSAIYATESDGYDIKCVEDFGAPCTAFAVMTPGTLPIVLMNNSTLTLPTAPSGYIWNIQAKEVNVSDGTANNVVVLWNRAVYPLPEAWIDGYSGSVTTGVPVNLHINLIRGDLISEAVLYTSVEGELGPLTMSADKTTIDKEWTPDGDYTDATLWIILVDQNGKSVRSKNTLTLNPS